jgi:ABC-type nitrate/sulfonate/bicarbonate transport system permease component
VARAESERRPPGHSASGPLAGAGDAAVAAAPLELDVGRGARRFRVVEPLIFVLSIASALALWELAVRAGWIAERDLPAMSSTLSELWDLMQTEDFWAAFAKTVRGWALGLAIAAALAIPIGIVLGSSEFLASAFRMPIEFLRPIPSAALIPLLLLTPALGIRLRSEIFLAAFGAFWPLLVQTMYGVRDVDPVALDTARSFGVPRLARLYRITLPSAVPYIATGLRIASTVSLILAFTAELFMGLPGLGQLMEAANTNGDTLQIYALAVAVGFLGLAIHLLSTAFERRALRWHPSQRVGAT